MVDYWVSKERHYCKYCNAWMQNDKMAALSSANGCVSLQSIKHHEQGRRHKEKVEETLKLKRQAKSDANNSQKEQPSRGGQYRPPVELEKEPEDEEDDKGVYAVRGVVYLEGKKHETQLETGSACQIWVEEAEQWIDALVELATLRRFTVMYMLPPSEEALKEGEKPKPMTEREVLADQKMVDQWRNGGDAAESNAKPSVIIDETTGMGVE
ncbi:Zinc finger, C2H2-type matrin [Phytophthora cactorum]|nr:Zinc finger, C2H2-type matrin [Phytophthora cactorum]